MWHLMYGFKWIWILSKDVFSCVDPSQENSVNDMILNPPTCPFHMEAFVKPTLEKEYQRQT